MPEKTLTWDSEAQHHNAQHRHNVSTTTFGGRNGNHIRVGHDPNHGLAADAEVYIPMDGSTTEGTRCAKTGMTASRSGTSTYANGILGRPAVEFNGSGNGLGYGSVDAMRHSGAFSVAMWVTRDRLQQARESLVSYGFNIGGDWHLEARDNGRLLFFYYNSSDSFQQSGSLHYNQMTTGLHYVGLSFSGGSSPSATVYLDDQTDTASFSGSRPTPQSDSTLRFGRMADRDSYPYAGRIDEFMYFDRSLSSSEHAELRNLVGGEFTSVKQSV